MDTILVTGGTGTIGSRVVHQLNEAGHNVRVFARETSQHENGVQFISGDLLSGTGVDAAVAGVATIVHCAGNNKDDVAFTQRLVRAAARAGQPHLVYISVVGAERIPVSGRIDRKMFSYFDMKRKAEQVISNSGLPWTTIRATQVHDLLFLVIEMLAKMPIVPVPSGVKFQPVDVEEVAARLVALALGRPMGLVPDIGGPRVYGLAELIRSYLERTHQRRLLLPLWLPGRAARALRSGANLAPKHAVGTRTWEEFLADRLSKRQQLQLLQT